MSVLVIGSVTCDVSIFVDHLPYVEEDVNVKRQKMSPGGCAYNVADILRRMHVPYQLACNNGTGVFAEFVREEMKKKGMEPMFHSKEENGVCYTFVDHNGNRTFAAVHGAEYHFTRQMLDSIDLKDTDLIYFCGLEMEEDTGGNILSFLEEHRDIPMFFAPGPRIMWIPEEIMKRILALHPSGHLNRKEGSAFTHAKETNEIVWKLREKGFDRVVMTDGGNPVTVCSNRSMYAVPACRADVIDGTGAGDSHIGTILGCLEKKWSLSDAVIQANRISAAVTECEGPVLTDEKAKEIGKELL